MYQVDRVQQNNFYEVINLSKDVIQTNVTEDFEIMKNAEGKYQRKAIYKPFSSVTATTKEEKIKLMNLLEGEGDSNPMNENIGKTLNLVDVIFNPYSKIDEDTGEVEYGVLSYLISDGGETFVTSSKSVYHSIKKMFTVFGQPHYNDDEKVTLEIVKKEGQRFKFIDVKLIG